MMTVILTGGASRRMGRDKASLDMDGQPLALMLAERYSLLGGVCLSAARSDSFADSGYTVLPDRYPGCGPLNGLISAFSGTDEDKIFLTAVDLPFGDASLARVLLDELGGHDVCVIQRENGSDEPTFAAYSRTCLEAAESCIREGYRSFKQLFARLDVRRISESELGQFDLSRVLFNMNAPSDYKFVMEELTWKK